MELLFRHRLVRGLLILLVLVQLAWSLQTLLVVTAVFLVGIAFEPMLWTGALAIVSFGASIVLVVSIVSRRSRLFFAGLVATVMSSSAVLWLDDQFGMEALETAGRDARAHDDLPQK